MTGQPGQHKEVANWVAYLTALTPTTQPTTTQPATATQPAAPVLDEDTKFLIGWLDSLAKAQKLEWARRQLVPQRVAIQISELVKAGKLDDAKALAEALARFDAQFKIAAQMRDVLSESGLEATERGRRIAALADEARKAFDPIIRELKLRDRLDERLHALAVTASPAAMASPTSTRPAVDTRPATEGIEGAGPADAKVRVTVLAVNTQRPTLDALRQASLQIEATATRTRLVVGQVPRQRLADLALLDAVLRVEPTEGAD